MSHNIIMAYPNWDDFFNLYNNDFYRPRSLNRSMKEIEKIFKAFVNDDETKDRMSNLSARNTLKATVKRNGKVYKITVEDITPKPEEIPDEISIEWDESGAFSGGHEDLTEWCKKPPSIVNLK